MVQKKVEYRQDINIAEDMRKIKEMLGFSYSDIRYFGLNPNNVKRFESTGSTSMDTVFRYNDILHSNVVVGKYIVENLEQLGKKLKQLREEHSLTYDKMFMATGLGNRSITAIESGKGCTTDTIRRYLMAMPDVVFTVTLTFKTV